MRNTHVQQHKFNKIKNIKQTNTTTPTTTNSPYRNKNWNQNKYELGTWTKPKFEQSLSLRIANKNPQHFNSYPSIIQSSICSNISSLTKVKSFKTTKNKVKQFLNKWKNRKNNKTKIQNNSMKQNSNDELSPHNQHSIESSTNWSRTIENFNHNISDNQPSLQSSSTKLTRDPNATSSPKKNHSPIAYSKWQPAIANTSRLNAYTHNNKPKKTLTFDRTIDPKRKALTPTKLHLQRTQQDSLKAFGFRVKGPSQSHHIPQLPIDKTTQTTIHQIEHFDTNEFKGEKLTLLTPNHIRICYMHINGLELGKGGHILLQLCLTLKEKGVGIVSITKTNVHWEWAHDYHNFKQTLKDAWPKNKITFCTSESDIKWNLDCKLGGTAMFTLNNV